MKTFFLTRVHPPVTGGLENQSYNLVNNFKKINKETFVIANTKGKKALPYFLPIAYVKALKLIRKNKITHLHLSDGLMAIIGARLRRKTGVKTIVTIHRGGEKRFCRPARTGYRSFPRFAGGTRALS